MEPLSKENSPQSILSGETAGVNPAGESAEDIGKIEPSEIQACSSTNATTAQCKQLSMKDFRKRSLLSKEIPSVSKKMCLNKSKEVSINSELVKVKMSPSSSVLVSKDSSLEISKKEASFSVKTGSLEISSVKKEDSGGDNRNKEALHSSSKLIKNKSSFGCAAQFSSPFESSVVCKSIKTGTQALSTVKKEVKTVTSASIGQQQIGTASSATEKSSCTPRRGRRVPFITLSRSLGIGGQFLQPTTTLPDSYARRLEFNTLGNSSSVKAHVSDQEKLFSSHVVQRECLNKEKHNDFSDVNKLQTSAEKSGEGISKCASVESQNDTSEKMSLHESEPTSNQNSRKETCVEKTCDPADQTVEDRSSHKASRLDELAEIASSVASIETENSPESSIAVLNSVPSSCGCVRHDFTSKEGKCKVCQHPTENSSETNSDGSRRRRRRRRRANNPGGIDDILDDLDTEIDSLLEVTAQRNKLSLTNVKDILKHVMTNDYVLDMVRNTMKPDDESVDVESPTYQPKLTRSKTKEFREKKAQIPWLVSSTAKQSNNLTSVKLLEGEFSDHDSTSDEEYKPEEECPSDEEESNLNAASEAESPAKTQPPDPLEETPLVIAELQNDSICNAANEADRIALRTRSKLPLNDTPLEAIEASFVAPDITVDMYDAECDDEEWRKFLWDFTKPLDTKVLEDQPDDAEDDPEYNFKEEEDVLDDCEINYDKDLKIPRTELKALMRELLEAAEQELMDLVEEEDSDIYPPPTVWFPAKEHMCKTTENTFEMLSRSMTDSEKLQLQEQMRMHVQLLCQTYLLSKDNPFFVNYGYCAKDMLVELKTLSDRELPNGKVSAFKAANLDGAVKIVNEFVLNPPNETASSVPKVRKTHGIRSVKAKKTMAFDKTFIYPDLLPYCSFRKYIDSTKTIFTNAEDNLIALGLEQFSEMQRHIHLIHEYILPTKTEQQIRFRIKNAKTMKYPADHPIRYFCTNKKCPPFPRTVRPFDPCDIKPPAEMPPEIMPKWMRPFLIRHYVPLAPIVCGLKPKSTIVKLPVQLTPEKRHYSPILPRGSPMKQVIPILRKYGQHRRSIILASPTKRMPKFPNKPARPPLRIAAKRKILPKLTVSNNAASSLQIPSLQVPCVDSTSAEVPVDKRPRVDTANLGAECAVSECKENSFSRESPLKLSMATSYEPCNQDVAAENESQNEMETCEEGEDEAVDDEQDLAALMMASSTICKKQNPVVRKKNRHQKDVESTLALLCPDLMESDPKKADREEYFAHVYLQRILDTFQDNPEKLQKFFQTLLKFENKENNLVTLFNEVEEILSGYPALLFDFIEFLDAEQAKKCGKYQEYLMFRKITSFLRKVEVHFSQQPQQIQKIIRALTQLNQQTNVTAEAVIRTLQPLLRNQSHLIEELFRLLPDERPPESLMTDFEDITIPDSDADQSSIDSFEDIIIPETADPYGGKDCPCSCHLESTDVRMQNRNRHCAKCGTKFLDGKVYIQTGKVLKPAQVIYHSTIELQSSPKKEIISSSKGNCKMPRETDSPSSSPSCSPHPSHSLEDAQQLAESQRVTTFKQKMSSPISGPKASAALTSPLLSSSIGVPVLNNSPSPEKSLQKALEDHLEDVPVTTLPCPVIEDAVLPPDSSSKLSSVPSDFSHLKDVIYSSLHSPKKSTIDCSTVEEIEIALKASSCETSVNPIKYCIDSEKQTEVRSTDPVAMQQSSSSSADDPFLAGQQSDVTTKGNAHKTAYQPLTPPCSVSCETSKLKWTRDEDAAILMTCKEHGISDESFSIIRQSIKEKSIHQIKNRLEELLELYKMKAKGNVDNEDQE